MKKRIVLLRASIGVVGVLLLAVLCAGELTIPFSSAKFHEPCTLLFILLLFALVERFTLHRLQRRVWTPARSALVLGIFVWMMFLSNFRWRGSGDCVAASVQPFAFLREGNLYLERYHDQFFSDELITGVYVRNGHLISKYPSAAGLSLIPFYILPAVSGIEPTNLMLHQLQKMGASGMASLAVVFLYLSLLQFLDKRWAVILALCAAFGTGLFNTSSQAIWQHAPGQMCLYLGLYLLVSGKARGRDIYLSGFPLALAVWCRYSNVFLYMAMFLYVVLYHRKALIGFFLASAVPFICLFLDNAFHSGSPFRTGYPEKEMVFSTNVLQGVAGLLVSPARGLLLYSPIVLLGCWGIYLAWRKWEWPLIRCLSLACAAVTVFYARYEGWPGGWCFGPRYLTEITPLLVFAIIPVVPYITSKPVWRLFFQCAAAYSIFIQVLGTYLTWWWEGIPIKIWSWSNYPITFLFTVEHGAKGVLAAKYIAATVLEIGICIAVYKAVKLTRPQPQVPR